MITALTSILRALGRFALGCLVGLGGLWIAWIGIDDDNAELIRGDKTPLSGYQLPLMEGDWNLLTLIHHLMP